MKTKTWQTIMKAGVVFIMSMTCCVAWSQSNETKVGIDDVPSPVRTTILNAVGDGTLVDIGEFIEDGRVVHYEIEMHIDGQEYDVLIAPDGKILDKIHEGAVGDVKARLEEAEFFIEYNASDQDAGVQIFLDGGGWSWLEIYNPSGKRFTGSAPKTTPKRSVLRNCFLRVASRHSMCFRSPSC